MAIDWSTELVANANKQTYSYPEIAVKPLTLDKPLSCRRVAVPSLPNEAATLHVTAGAPALPREKPLETHAYHHVREPPLRLVQRDGLLALVLDLYLRWSRVQCSSLLENDEDKMMTI